MPIKIDADCIPDTLGPRQGRNRLAPVIEEAWFATVKTQPGEPRPRLVTVSRDAESLQEYADTLASANPRATYAVIPVKVVSMAGLQLGDEVRVVTPDIQQTATGHLIEIRNGLGKVRYGSGSGSVEIPVQHLEAVSRRVRFKNGGQ